MYIVRCLVRGLEDARAMLLLCIVPDASGRFEHRGQEHSS